MPRKRNPEVSRAQILDAAETLFAQKGFAGTSMRQVARLSDKSQALIHHHFSNKEGLWEAVKARFGTRFAEILLPLLDTQPSARGVIVSWFRSYLEFWKSNPNLRRIMLWRQLENDAMPWDATNLLFESGIRKFQAAQKDGALRGDIEAGHFISILTGSHLQWLNNLPAYCHRLGLDPDDPGIDEGYLRDLEEMLLNGLLTKES